MKYFIEPKDRDGSMYWEFFRGPWNIRNKWWNENSICLDWVYYKEIEELIYKIIPNYDHYGETEVSKSQWEQIKVLALAKGGEAASVVTEAEKWMVDTFSEHSVFTILGL